jgi:hypothetical protein
MRLNRPSSRSRQRGSVLIEIAMSYATLVLVAVMSLNASINATFGQGWTIKQAMSDAFITRESALAARIPFAEITSTGSPWALHPGVSTSVVTIGRLPGGQPVSATVHRTRLPDPNNLPAAGGTGTAESNPAGTEAWQLQSILAYQVGEKTYVKSRTILRIR